LRLRSSRGDLAGGVAVAVAAVAVHARTIAFGFTSLDDVDLLVGDHAFLARGSALWRAFGRSHLYVVDPRHAYYRPLVTVSYALDAQWSGVRPFGYHATNVALHAVACVLLHALLRRLSLGGAFATAGALVFAVHPVVAAAVAWIPGRNDVLLGVFALAAWLNWLTCVRDRSVGSWRGALHYVFFALALFAKETAIVLPLVCVAHVALDESQRSSWVRLKRPAVLGSFAAGWVLVVAAWAAVRSAATQQSFAETGVAALRSLGAGVTGLASGLGQLAVPMHLSLIADSSDVPVWPGLAVACGIVLATWRIPGVRRRVVALGVVVFALWLAPAIAAGGSLLLQSRLYLPACGVVIVAAEIARAIAPAQRTLAAVAGTLVGVLALVTLGYEGTFADPLAFARNAVDESPRSSLAHFCLGQAWHASGRTDRALAEYEAALSLGATLAVHNDIAVIYMVDARWDDAERELRAEIAVDPDFAIAHANLGVVLRREGRLDEACAEQARALALDPDDERAARERETYCVRPP
jgi:Flp pilus assembly protein TadD